MEYSHSESLRKDKRAVAPAVSTVILTGSVVAMILVAMTFANTFLDSRLAENEFSTNKQFMLTTGLQIDDIAWTIGRTQTVRYSSKYGNMKFQSSALTYTFEVSEDGTNWETLDELAGYTMTGMILYNVPVRTYTISNNYFERMLPSSDGSFLQEGSTAPVSHVFCIEKLPMNDGNYTRIVAVPTIRMLNSTIVDPSGVPMSYTKFYLPVLWTGTHLYRSQSVTLTGDDIIKVVRSDVNHVRITVTYGNAGSGFDADFFKFDHNSEVVDLADNSVIEVYIGKVVVTLGKI